MNPLADQTERDRFVAEQGKNISVIAPAGVGKTHTIVERIVHLARRPEKEAIDRLSRLVVVTYSVRAAQEMQQRSRTAIRASGVSSRVQRAFQQAFFGTIHSYCVQLLDRYGHYLGLPSPVALLQADDDFWNRFLVHGLGRETPLDPHLRELFHFYSPEKLYALGKSVSPGPVQSIGPVPELNFTLLLNYSGLELNARTRTSVITAQAMVKRWSTAWARGDRFHSLPKSPKIAAPEFLELWTQTFAPLQDWLREAALAFGRRIANAYEAFRLSEAMMTYDDQVRIALRVLDHPQVQRELAAERLSVLLDEAQDTDPLQFQVLLRVAGLRDGARQADGQSFCIVGDFQQAIYAPRSNLGIYQQVHTTVSAEPRGTSSRLHVTFRCDRAIIDFVNRVFPPILDAKAGQSIFVPLTARHDAGPGRVARWLCPGLPVDPNGKKPKVEVCARHEAQYLSEAILNQGLAGLGVHRWRDVAVLCPRRDWLLEIQRELAARNLPVQLHSADEHLGDRAVHAWATALVWVAAHPDDTFETAGVLREIFGVSDHDMAIYTAKNGERLRLDRSHAGEGPVQSALDVLRKAIEGAESLPLDLAVKKLIEETSFHDRLVVIGEQPADELQRELNDFSALVATRSAEGRTLTELAEELRLSLGKGSPAQEEIHDAIQLLTSHKAKGLEWQTVIVPFVFRPIGFKSDPYPRLVQSEQGEEMIFRDEADYSAGAKEFVTRRDRQQLQRLLYVACTRARHTLVFVDDESVFQSTARRGTASAADLLGFSGGMNSAAWKEVPETLSTEGGAPAKIKTAEEIALAVPGKLSKRDLQKALEHANAIPRRMTPHALAQQPHDEAEPAAKTEKDEDRVTTRNTGTLYGTWWHELVQTVPWQKPDSFWQHHFDEAQLRSPQPERSKREWDLFCASSLARWLAEPGRLIQVEFPFLWLEANQVCVEGVIDLAVYTPGDSSWRVIDWKTNRIGTDGAAGLVAIYRGQIEAYVRVLRDMLFAEVKGSLYLTQSGEWVDVE